MLRKVGISPFQGFLSLAIELVGALPRPEVCDPFRVGGAFFHEVETYYSRGQSPRTRKPRNHLALKGLHISLVRNIS